MAGLEPAVVAPTPFITVPNGDHNRNPRYNDYFLLV